MIGVEATQEHAWLRKFLGLWDYEGRSEFGPDGVPMEFRGRETVRGVGDLWVRCEGVGTCAGVDTEMILTIGFDPSKGRFVGHWIGSMMASMFVYEGWLEENGKRLVLETEGACPMEPGKRRTFRDITEFVDDDHRRFWSEMKGDDGSWSRMVQFDLRRRP